MIMHVITNFTGKEGAQTMLARLLAVTQDKKVCVVSLMDISQRNLDLANNPNVSYSKFGASSSLGMLGSVIRLAKLIRSERPTAIVCWMYHSMVVGLVAQKLARVGIPVIWNVRQSLDDPKSFSKNTRLVLNIGRALSAMPAGIIYNSARALELHKKYGYKNHNSIVIPNGFDLPEDVVINSRTPLIFGIAGRFHPQKDHETFFRAAALVVKTNPNTHFKAVGSGLTWDNPAVAEMLKKIGLPTSSIELCGEYTDMSPFYRNIDVLVLSSRTEGFPNVVAEAMSYGKPVVTTDVGDAAAIVGNAGYVVAPRDPESLATAIRKMTNLPPDRYAEISKCARAKIVEEFEIKAIELKYQNFINLQSA
jgi:glycosyltransferase involved in cell wall biosynthesis